MSEHGVSRWTTAPDDRADESSNEGVAGHAAEHSKSVVGGVAGHAMATATLLNVATYSAPRNWRRWHGTIKDLCGVVSVAAHEMATWSPKEVAIHVTVEYRGGLTASDLALDDFAQMPVTDLPRIRRVEIVVGERFGAPSSRIVLDGGNNPSVRLQVDADDRSRAEGLATRLASILDGGGSFFGGEPLWFALLLLVSAGASLAVGRAAGTPSTVPLRDAAIYVGGALLVITGLLLPYLFPSLEFVTPGGRTRVRRFRAALIGVLLPVSCGVIAILLVGLFQTH